MRPFQINILDGLKHFLLQKTILSRLMLINIVVWVACLFISVFTWLFNISDISFVTKFFAVPSDIAALAEKLNAEAPQNLAIAMKEVDGLLIHVSTDYVFGLEPYNTPCNPNQKGTPTGVYGTTKKLGEENIIASGCKYIILRTAWLYSEFGKNFCKTMLHLTVTKPQLKVVFDQCGTPTYAYDLAAAIYDIITNRKYEGNSGIYHYSNEGVTSWYDFTKMIQRIAIELKIHKSEIINQCDIQPCYSSEYPSPVKRPAYSVLDKKTFKETFGTQVPYWVDSLEVCIKNITKP